GERGVAGGIQEADDALGRFDVVGADVLGDATGLAGRNLGAADVVQQRGLAVVDVAHDGDYRRTRGEVALRTLDVGHQLGLGVVAVGAHRLVAEFLGHQRGGVVVDGLGDGGHHAHLEQRLDHVAALERELLRQVGHGDRIADGNLAHDRGGRTLEAADATIAVAAATAVLAALRLAAATRTGGAGAARTVGGRQVQLAGEAVGRIVVVAVAA